ncbi:MAG: DNA integrity scanning protein DisA nucleotide-binding domain protein [Bacilli bacterium]|nr:DNA integrity scanning protein DisA nucleotide-binding domain protein [Bacilli bacterium]
MTFPFLYFLSGPIGSLDHIENLLSFLFAFFLLAGLGTVSFFLFKRLVPRIFILGGGVVILLSWLFGLNIVAFVAGIILACGIVYFLIANMNENREFVGNNMLAKGGKAKSKRRIHAEALFDREAMYKKIETAVFTLSRQKVGALITFEKKDSLTAVMKSGTRIDAPVSAELLQTIFYPGTRLHDGAVIIRNDKIVAASVYFTPTTRPLSGKYGSRHRAAIGISEICDAVTVVVSEETGRVSIAYEGELQPVAPDTFLETFETYMSQAKESSQE